MITEKQRQVFIKALVAVRVKVKDFRVGFHQVSGPGLGQEL